MFVNQRLKFIFVSTTANNTAKQLTYLLSKNNKLFTTKNTAAYDKVTHLLTLTLAIAECAIKNLLILLIHLQIITYNADNGFVRLIRDSYIDYSGCIALHLEHIFFSFNAKRNIVFNKTNII